MTEDRHLLHQLETQMLKADLYFWYQYIMSGVKSGYVVFGYQPFLSLFVIESFSYLSLRMPEFKTAGYLKQHEHLHTAARHSVKLFDDIRKYPAELMSDFASFLDLYHSLMNRNHTGILGSLKRVIQNDLGLFFFDSHLITTTQSGLFFSGVREEEFESREVLFNSLGTGRLFFSIGHEIGSCIGELWLLLQCEHDDILTNSEQFEVRLREEKFTYQDAKAKRQVQRTFNGQSLPELNFSLLTLLCMVNHCLYIVDEMIVGDPSTKFKIRYLTLYHVLSSLQKLWEYFQENSHLTDISRNFFAEILTGKDKLSLSERHVRQFRNILVHYALYQNFEPEYFHVEKKYFGLIEYYFDGLSYGDLCKLVKRELKRLSMILEVWYAM